MQPTHNSIMLPHRENDSRVSDAWATESLRVSPQVDLLLLGVASVFSPKV